MFFKVYIHESFDEVPVRENTKTIYIESNSEAEARKLLALNHYNVEYITPISGEYLEYEQKSPDFKVEKLSQ